MRLSPAFRFIACLSLSVVTAATFGACATEDEETDADGSGEGSGETPTGGTFKVRVLHASGDTPAVAIYVNDAAPPAIPSLEFGDTTGLIELNVAQYTFNVRATSAAPDSAPAISADLVPDADGVYSVVAIGNLGGTPQPLEELAFAEDLTPPADGQIKIRAVHAASALGQVDIWNIVEGDDAALIPDFDYGTVTEGYIEVPAGSYTLGVDADNDPSVYEAVFVTGNVAAGEIVNLVAAINPDGNPVLIAQFTDGTSSVISATSAGAP
jgi:hypothetical protein